MVVVELSAFSLFLGSCMLVLMLVREEYSGTVTPALHGLYLDTTLLVHCVSCSGQFSGHSCSLVPFTTSRYCECLLMMSSRGWTQLSMGSRLTQQGPGSNFSMPGVQIMVPII